jgi:hypothetical protein
MSKASVTIDDSFIFRFPKRKEESTYNEASKKIVTTYKIYPQCLLEHFLAHVERIEIAHKGITDRQMDWQYHFNPAIDPLYLFELTLVFESKDENKRGSYGWEFSIPADTRLTFSDIKVHEEDEEFEYLMIRIAGEISWDFKPNHFQKIQEKMEEYCPWEDVAMGLRLTLRENYLWKKGDFSGYKSGMGVPESEQTIDNLPFILDLMPKSWCIISHRDPKDEWEVSYKHWTKLSDKKITFSGKYLSPFNR